MERRAPGSEAGGDDNKQLRRIPAAKSYLPSGCLAVKATPVLCARARVKVDAIPLSAWTAAGY